MGSNMLLEGHMTTPRSVTREVLAALGAGLFAAMGTWLAVASVRWFPNELRWFNVSLSLIIYGHALRRFWVSRHLLRLRRRLGLSQFRIFRLECAVQLLAGGLAMVGALILLVKSDTAQRRVMGVLAVLGALAWFLLWAPILRGIWGVDDQPDVTDAP
jgi:hypothetical protein